MFWKIHEIIRPHLIKLNDCKNIQPLYSCYPKSGSNTYLKFAYTKDVETAVENIVLKLRNEYPGKTTDVFIVDYFIDEDNENCSGGASEDEELNKMGCLINPDFFRVKNIKLSFQWGNYLQFWNNITNQLTDLG